MSARPSHAAVPAHGTGCTVVLGPPAGLRAAVAVRGRATGTREIDALNPRHLVERIDAILFAGGSAYGLGAADGVMRWLRERGRGLPVGPAGTIPIVPTAVILDLGKMMKAGLGTSAARAGDVVVGALVVLNAVGDVRDARGEIIAGARGPDGRFLDSLRFLAEGGAPFGDPDRLTRNTTLAVVATNAALDRVQLEALAQAGSDSLARRITPYGTLFDGDVVFAVSTAAVPAASPLQVEALAALAVPEAVERAVR